MTLAEWEQLGNAVLGFGTGIAFAIGAVWAVFRFWTLAELKQVKLQIRQQERELLEHPVIDLTVSVEQTSYQGDNKYITATVFARNHGSSIARLAYEDKPAAKIFKVSYSDDGLPSFAQALELQVSLASNPNDCAKTTIVRPGQTQEIPFHFRVKEHGAYYFAFRAVQSEHDREALSGAGVPSHRIVSWTAKKYFIVDERATEI